MQKTNPEHHETLGVTREDAVNTILDWLGSDGSRAIAEKVFNVLSDHDEIYNNGKHFLICTDEDAGRSFSELVDEIYVDEIYEPLEPISIKMTQKVKHRLDVLKAQRGDARLNDTIEFLLDEQEKK